MSKPLFQQYVLSPVPLISGAVIRCRPVGVLLMADEAGDDAKVLALPINEVCKTYQKIESYLDLPDDLLNQIAHFFEHYKDLDEGKWVRVDGWGGISQAKQEILNSIKQYQDAPVKPNF